MPGYTVFLFSDSFVIDLVRDDMTLIVLKIKRQRCRQLYLSLCLWYINGENKIKLLNIDSLCLCSCWVRANSPMEQLHDRKRQS